MLKLIYSLSGKEITLKYKKRETLWSKEFILAFLFTLGVHVGSFYLFKVNQGNKPLEKTLEPSKVYAEYQPLKPLASHVHVDSEGLLLKPLSEPQKKAPKLPLDQEISSRFIDESKELRDQSFYHLKIDPKNISHSCLKIYKQVDPFKVQVYKPLNNRFTPLVVRKKKVPIGSTKTLSILFEIQVEDRTGYVFSTHLKESSGYSEFDQIAQKLSKNLTFIPKRGGFITRAPVEVQLEVNIGDLP